MSEKHGTGVTRRRRRLSDEETAERMLQAAVTMVNATGLTVSLDHLSFEEVIREAGVARSAVYRRWPYKDLFFSDLLRELARAAAPAAVTDEASGRVVRRIIRRHRDDLAEESGRARLLSDLLREAGRLEFETISGSPEWRTYLALHTTYLSLPAGEVRDDVQAALAASEQRFLDQIADAYAHVSALLGYHPRPGMSFPAIAALAQATMRGLAVLTPLVPTLAEARHQADPVGTGETSEWSLPALGIATTLAAHLEPDPAVTWTPERVSEVQKALLADPFGSLAQ